MFIFNTQIIALLPALIIGITVVVIMLSIACRRNLFWHVLLTIFGFSSAIISLRLVWTKNFRDIFQFMCIDNFAIFYIILILVSSLSSAILAYKWLLSYPRNRDEFYLLLLVSSIGGILLATASHLAILFLGIELISLPLFGLVGYSFFKKFSLEASIKYIILSGVSSSFILFGIALIYAATGYLSFANINRVLHLYLYISQQHQPIMLVTVGLGMIMVGFGFKLSLVPFHLWASDIYQGAPSAVSLYITSASKVAIISILIRFLMIFPEQYSKIFCIFLSGSACCSVLFGNLMAIKQNNIKRVLAYSSIAHIGYVLIGVIAILRSNPMSVEILGIYLMSYLLASIGVFGVITIMSMCYPDRDSDILSTYRGLFWYRPVLSVMFTILMLSLAGMPITLGFISKFYLFILGINSQLWWLTIFVAINSIVGIFYYFRIVINLYLSPLIFRTNICSNICLNWIRTPNGVLVIVVVFFVLFLGLYPQPIINFVHAVHPILLPIG